MKSIYTVRTAFAAIVLAAPAVGQAINPKPFVVPEVREWKGADDSLKLVDGVSRICYSSPSLEGVAHQMAGDYAKLTGETIEAVNAKGGEGDIILKLKDNKKLGREGYSIDVTDRVVITASTEKGLRWGATTLLQLRDASSEIPKGHITDFPDYGFRGFMIDAGRKYIPIDYLYKLVDVLAYHKMNVLHIHLNDNGFKEFFNNDWNKTQAAFRLECETYPGLTARDGSYSKNEIRDLQKYALRRGVEIIPEIDFPAHSLAFTRYKPEIACDGVHNDRDHLDLSNPKTYEFMDALLKEYLDGEDPVFVGGKFHIGTDEYHGDSIAMEQFRALTDRYVRYTEDFGKQPLVWGSLTHAKGKTPVKTDNVLMYLWSNDYADPAEMLELGYDVVSIPDMFVYIVPGAGYYYDYLDTEKLYNEWTPAQIGGVKIREKHPQLQGGMFAVWNDHPDNGITTKDIHHRVMHALPTMASKTWAGTNVTVPYAEFRDKSSAVREAPGVNYLGRQGNVKAIVYESPALIPGCQLPLDEIGYDYTVEFDIEGASEDKGTVLFSTPDATVWLSDPIRGTMGYSREGKLMSFRHDVRPGEKNHYRITGNNKGTRLYIDGKLVDDMNISWATYGDKLKRNKADIKTLVFPLKNAGKFKSKVTNLKVMNYIEDK